MPNDESVQMRQVATVEIADNEKVLNVAASRDRRDVDVRLLPPLNSDFFSGLFPDFSHVWLLFMDGQGGQVDHTIFATVEGIHFPWHSFGSALAKWWLLKELCSRLAGRACREKTRWLVHASNISHFCEVPLYPSCCCRSSTSSLITHSTPSRVNNP